MCLPFVFLLAVRVPAWVGLSRRSSAWKDAEILLTQQARNLLMDLDESADRITFLIRDRDILYPPELEHLSDAGITTARSAVRAPRMNAIMERWIGGCRRELLDRTLIWNLPHLRRILREYETHHNTHRPHMALASAAPDKPLPPEVTNLDTFRTRHLPHSKTRACRWRHAGVPPSSLTCRDDNIGKHSHRDRSTGGARASSRPAASSRLVVSRDLPRARRATPNGRADVRRLPIFTGLCIKS